MSFYSLNYTLQDLIGYTLAFFLFPLVIVLPGYVFSSALDLFDFKYRLPVVKLGIGLLVSFAVSPIIFNFHLRKLCKNQVNMQRVKIIGK